jgi:tellurite resistance protein TehA-like permease
LPQQVLAVVLGFLLAAGLAGRAGGRPVLCGLLAAAVGAAAVATGWATLLAGAALALGVVAACLAVLGTVPASSFLVAVREVLLAGAVAGTGALGVAALGTEVDVGDFRHAVLALGLTCCFALVYRLGGGLHGLGRRGLVLAVGALVLLVLGIVYTAALGRWGSPTLIEHVESYRGWARDHLGAVPHPVVVLLGVPALTWGVAMRDRRRQGWWACAFGAAATATATTRLVDVEPVSGSSAIAAGYSVALGLVVGYLVLRVERLLTRTGGQRARRQEQLDHRPEPTRLHPLH